MNRMSKSMVQMSLELDPAADSSRYHVNICLPNADDRLEWWVRRLNM